MLGVACEAAAAAWDWLLLVLSHFLDEHVSAGGCLAWRHTSESLPGPGPATGSTSDKERSASRQLLGKGEGRCILKLVLTGL